MYKIIINTYNTNINRDELLYCVSLTGLPPCVVDSAVVGGSVVVVVVVVVVDVVVVIGRPRIIVFNFSLHISNLLTS